MNRVARTLLLSVVLAGSAQAAEPYVAESLRPYLNNEVNALELNHLFLQSMLEMDRIPVTVGTAVRASPAQYRRMDGKITDAGLAKNLYTLSLGLGHPRTGFGAFVGGIASNIRPSDFPNIWALSGDGNELIRASGTSAVFFGGLAYKGTVLQLALHRTELGFDASAAGLFVPGGCNLQTGCSGRLPREFAPVESPPVSYGNRKNALLINLENGDGYHAEALIGSVEDIADTGEMLRRKALAAAKVLGMPKGLIPEQIGRAGAGLNLYDKAVDYYGDRSVDVQQAAQQNEPPPATDKRPMLELPLVGGDLGETGLQARVVPQILPVPTLRLLEVGISHEGALGNTFVPSLGGRAKVFKRGKAYQPSVDAFAGLLLSYGDLSHEVARGVSVVASYSFNSPDSLTFVPIPGTHVLGLQMIVGNATALPPPLPIMREASGE